MTIYELKRRNIAHGGCFFSKENMRGAGDTLKSYRMTTMRDGNILLFRKVMRQGVNNRWIFNPTTGRIIPDASN